MAAPQQIRWEDIEKVLRASGQPIGQVPFGQLIVNIGAVQGGVLNFALPGQQAADRIRPLPQPPRVLPRQVPGFLDREQEQGRVGHALVRGQVADVHGADGVGKTALISQVMHSQLPTAFPDGLVYLRAANETYDDLLQELLKQFYEVGKEPVRFTENDVRQHLAGKQALVAVDDANELKEDEAEALLQVVPQCALLVAGREQQVWQGTGVPLAGLPRDQAVALFERSWGQATPQDRPTVEAICQALGDVPKALIRTASMAAQRRVPLPQVLQEIQPQPERRDPMGQAAWMLGFHLSDGERRTLAGLAAPGGSTVGFEALAYITQIATAKLNDYLVRLQKMEMVQAVDGRYGLDEGLRPYIEQFGVDEEMRARAAHYYLKQAGNLRPHSKDPDEDNVVAALETLYRQGRWQEVIQIARGMDRYLATAGRWGSWRKQLEKALHAARQVGDRATEAWAQNQLGVVAVGAGSAAVAEGLFRGALTIWRALGNQDGMAIANWNLKMLLAPPPPLHKGKPEGKPGGGGSALPAILGGVAAVLIVTLGILIGVAVWPDRPTPLPPPPLATTRVPPTTVAPPPTDTSTPPRIDLNLAAGCGEVFSPGQNLDIQIWSNVDGSVELSWVEPGGGRAYLFSTAVRAGQTTRHDWEAPATEGRWVLAAELDGGRARDECLFSVEIPVEPQVQVWLEEGCGGTYDPGEALTIDLQANVNDRVAVYLVDSAGRRSQLFRHSVQASVAASRSWNAPQTEGTWTLDAVLDTRVDGAQVNDECRFQVEAPQIRVRLDGTCGQELEQDAQVQVSLWSNRSGEAGVYLAGAGQRRYLFGQTMIANQTSTRALSVGNTAGNWTLEAILNGGQAADQCAFAVANESVPPTIDGVWIEPMEGEVVCPGDEVWVYAQVFDASGLSRVELVGRPPEGYWASTTMGTIDDQTYRSSMTAHEQPGSEYYVYAEDLYGNSQTSALQVYEVEPCPTVLYDFVEMAPKATWTGITPDYPYAYALSFPGGTGDSSGFAVWQYNATLEDGSQPDHRILETHPTWTDGGQIQGAYDLRYPLDISIQAGDRFVGRVGFLYGAGAGDVTFRLRFYDGDPDSPTLTLAWLDDTYDGVVRDWVVPLDEIVGSSGTFYLVVEAGETSAQDWAVWVEARIERP
jgi:hypothetical protein